MKTKSVNVLSKGFIILSGVSLFSVCVMAFLAPQSVMDLVGVKLPNNDSYSSIRGVYGGVGLTLCITLIYLLRKNVIEALGLLSILWGLYAASRIITIFVEGPLGAFGTQWLGTELLFCAIAVCLFVINRKQASRRQAA